MRAERKIDKFLYMGDCMKRIMALLSLATIVSVVNLFAMERQPSSQGRYQVDWVEKGNKYLEDLNTVDFIDDSMRERGQNIKDHLGNDIYLQRKIARKVESIDQANVRREAREGQPAAQRKLFY
jgi:hypothetical protein